MAAGNFGPEDIEQARKCREEILTLMSDGDDIGAQRRETSHLNSKADKAHDLERQLQELQTELESKKSQQLEDKENTERRALAVNKKLQIMQHVLPGVVIDPNAQKDHIRGYIKTSSGDVKTFDFDTTRVTPYTMTDYFWESL